MGLCPLKMRTFRVHRMMRRNCRLSFVRILACSPAAASLQRSAAHVGNSQGPSPVGRRNLERSQRGPAQGTKDQPGSPMQCPGRAVTNLKLSQWQEAQDFRTVKFKLASGLGP